MCLQTVACIFMRRSYSCHKQRRWRFTLQSTFIWTFCGFIIKRQKPSLFWSLYRLGKQTEGFHLFWCDKCNYVTPNILIVVSIADSIVKFDFFEDLFSDGGVVTLCSVVVAESHLLSVFVLPHNYWVNNRHLYNGNYNSESMPIIGGDHW